MNYSKSFFLIPVFTLMVFFFTNCEKDPAIDDTLQTSSTTKTFDLGEAYTTLLAPAKPSNAVVNMQSSSDAPIVINVEVVADATGNTRKFERLIQPGEAMSEEYPQLVAMKAKVLFPPASGNSHLIFQAVYVPTDTDNGFNASSWLSAGTVCMNGDVKSEPDQDADCLWEKVTLWQAASKRDIDLEINLTGAHDMKVEIEGPVGIFQDYELGAAPAQPQFHKLSGEWEDVVAVHIFCKKSPVNPCGSCDYTYELCYK